MSVIACVAWLKMSRPLPVSLRIFVKVRSMFSPVAIVSSSIPDLREIAVARFWTPLALMLAASPVDLSTAAVWRLTVCDSRNSEMTFLVTSKTAYRPPPKPPAPSA
jgi:hypothetical protein